MCGICGIIYKNNQLPIKEEIINITNKVKHRGPDGEGYYLGRNFSFGHRRLAILDLSEAGHQPMRYTGKKGNYVIIHNGEIYNFLEIKKDLIKEGYFFNSNTDTEVIVASYDKWGEKCVDKFNGMWAFAIYDERKNIIFCSRDRFGIKPFYYANIEDKFIFASEIKSILPFIKKTVGNIDIIYDYLFYGLEEYNNQTFFKKIFKLKQSYNLIYDLDKHFFKEYKYFDIEINSEISKLNEYDASKILRDLLKNSVNLRLRSDVKVGTCLSGGLDSSSIAALASKKYFEIFGDKFFAIHGKSLEKKTDESYYAKIVANHCNLNLFITEPSLDEYTDYLNEVIFTQEEPFGGPSIILQYFVMKKAKEVGCKVMLDGQGGDETFFGYESYYSIFLMLLLKKLKLINYLKTLKNLPTFNLTTKKIIRDSIILFLRSFFFNIEKKFNKKINKSIQKKIEEIIKINSIEKFQQLEIFKYSLPKLLKYEDKNSMKNSIETRLPILDYRVVNTALSINYNLKFKNGYLKYIFRKSMENYLPKEIIWRKVKFGFEAPTELWLNKIKPLIIDEINKSILFNELIKIDINRINNKIVLWRIFNLAKWEKIFNINYEQ